jgi:hypothetical protein
MLTYDLQKGPTLINPKPLVPDPQALDCKIFFSQSFASFFFWMFGLGFAESGEIWRIRQITAEILRICQTIESVKLPQKFSGFAKL